MIDGHIYLNRKLYYNDRSRLGLGTKVGLILFVVIGVLMLSIRNFKSLSSTQQQIRPTADIGDNEPVTHMVSYKSSADQMNKNHCQIIIEGNPKQFTSTLTILSLDDIHQLYFSLCYFNMKEFEISLLYHLKRNKTTIPFVSSYSHSEVIKLNEYHCSKGNRLLLTFKLINHHHQIPKCIEIEGISIKDTPSILQLTLVSIIIKGNEVHLYEITKESIDFHTITNNHYSLIHNALYYNESIRLCLNEIEQSQFNQITNADKGIELQLITQYTNHSTLCFKNIYFIY